MCNKAVVILMLSSVICYAYGNQNSNCTCVPYYQCSEDGEKVITDGSGLLDDRTYSESTCTGYFDVCCDLTKADKIPEKQEEPKGCGYQKSGSFPWTVSLHYQQSAEYPRIYKCGSSLIHPQVVVTAAHCLSTFINLGMLTAQIGKIERTVTKIIIHPGYNSINLRNDLALVVLDKPIEMADNPNVICIPPPGVIVDQARCILSSMKTTNFFQPASLKLLKMPIVPPTKCAKVLRQTRLGAYFKLHKSFICAGGEDNVDACEGDGGSPLVCPVSNQPGRYHQVGIVSWGIGCGEFNIPGVYVNLGLFRDWIDEKMIDNGFNVNVYKY